MKKINHVALYAFGFIIFFSFTHTTQACTTNMTRGSEGASVTCLQQMLTFTRDYTYGSLTGFYGPATEAAVKRFQARSGIVTIGTPETTGYGAAGPQTRRAIIIDVIKRLQARIVELIAANPGSGTSRSGGGGSSSGGSSGGSGGGGGSSDDTEDDDGGTTPPSAPAPTPPIESEPEPTGELSIRLLPETDELVWDGNGASDCILPDGPFHMWKNANDVAVGIVAMPYNYILSSTVPGGAFEISPNQTPRKVFESPQRQLQSYYDSKMWMMGFWTDNGKDVYSVAHHEWYPAAAYRTYTGDPSEGCGEGGRGASKATDSWVNGVHHLTSTNGGLTFNTTVPLDPNASSNARRLVLVPEPYGADKPVSPDGVTRYGYFHPSNIVEENGYYYFTVGVQEIIESANGNPLKTKRQGLMFVRTDDISEPRDGSTYEFWDGNQWRDIANFLAVGRPFIFTHQSGLANSERVTGAEASLHAMSFTIKWNPKHEEWIILGYSRTRELYYLTTPSLADIAVSEMKKVAGSLFEGPQVDGTWFGSYPALIDPDSPGYVFQEVEGEAYLYYVDGDGAGSRDIRRMQVVVD